MWEIIRNPLVYCEKKAIQNLHSNNLHQKINKALEKNLVTKQSNFEPDICLYFIEQKGE